MIVDAHGMSIFSMHFVTADAHIFSINIVIVDEVWMGFCMCCTWKIVIIDTREDIAYTCR